MVYMTGSYARMRFNSPMNGYLDCIPFRRAYNLLLLSSFCCVAFNIDGGDYPSMFTCINMICNSRDL